MGGLRGDVVPVRARGARLAPALIGVIAGVGGASSFVGAVVATRATKRWGVGPVAIGAMLLAALGNLFIPLAPAGAPLLAVLFLIGQQLLGDSAVTAYDVTETSVKQSRVADRELGRVVDLPCRVGGRPIRRGTSVRDSWRR